MQLDDYMFYDLVTNTRAFREGCRDRRKKYFLDGGPKG
jgi:hypothetical protein